jgi:hypothetical protein
MAATKKEGRYIPRPQVQQERKSTAGMTVQY